MSPQRTRSLASQKLIDSQDAIKVTRSISRFRLLAWKILVDTLFGLNITTRKVERESISIPFLS